MNVNIVIGVGGTGAKVVESILHLSSAGLMADTLQVGLVDQDRSNGNVNRVERLIERLIQIRRLWRESGQAHTLGSCELFRTQISPVSATENVWTPHPDAKVTLAQIFDREAMPEDERRLFDGLFSLGEGPGNTEQAMELDQGYRGRPHIGAAAMTSRIEDDIDFWKSLLSAVNAAKGSKEVRILLAGSVFGGTGAAGFPTLAKLIRRKLPQGATNVRIGGVLMLPYFDFDPPQTDNEASPDANVAKSEELMQQSKSALKHYADLLSKEHIFDELYLVGWDKPFSVGTHHPGANAQANPPLAPELFAGLAAARFFHNAPSAAHGEGEVFAVARAKKGALTWADLPTPTTDSDAPLHEIGRLIRFAVSWKYWSGIVSRPEGSKAVRRDPWYKLQGIGDIDFNANPPETEVRELDGYADDLLRWAAAIEMHARAAKLNFDLWQLEAITARAADGSNNFAMPEALTEKQHDTLLGRVIVPGPRTGKLPGTVDLMRRLNTESEHDQGQRGLGVFVSALHAYSGLQPANQGA